MIRITAALALLGAVSCGRLDHLYLPPGANSNAGASARFSGGYQGSSANARIPILRLDANNEGDGSYRYAYETGNSIQAQEQGDARGDGTKAHGSYSYTAPDGQQVSITYTADENGFVPQGSHIPTPPPIPAEIQKALQQNLADEARGLVDDGQYRPSGDEGQYSGRNQGGFGGNFGGNGGNNGGYRY